MARKVMDEGRSNMAVAIKDKDIIQRFAETAIFCDVMGHS
jgi:hypothetical protein